MIINKELIKGHIENILLCLLKIENLYGYEIAKKIRTISKNEFEIKEGTLYVVLKRLEQNQLIEHYWKDEQSGGGRRKYYHITKSGQEYIKNKKKEWIFLKNIMDTFFMEV